MQRIVCEECGKQYDFERDDFCPKCGAFNQPVKTWGTDAQGNVIRLHGVSEKNHADSFVHSEVHKEKRVRQLKGMDRSGRAVQRPVPPRPPARPAPRKAVPGPLKVLFWVIAAIIFMNIILPLLGMLLMI